MAKTSTKSFRIEDGTHVKLEQLIALEKERCKRLGLSLPTSSSVIEEAINYYHSAKIGKEILLDSMTQLQEIIVNTNKLVLDTYAKQIAQSLNHLQIDNTIIKRLVVTLLKSADVLPEDPESLDKAIVTGKILEEKIEQIVKNEILNEMDR